jgi:type IV fimbrial biogenesis protein FimT
MNRVRPLPTHQFDQRGFTLIELMVTISVAAILLAIVVPSFRTFTQSQRVKAGSFDLYSTLMFARSEAVKRRTNVTITANGGNWNDGWEVSDGSTPPLRKQDSLKGLTITSNVTILTYRTDGRLDSDSAKYLKLAATGSSAAGRCITIDPVGMPRSSVFTGSAPCP